MIVKNEEYSPQRIREDQEKLRLKRVKQLQRNIQNLQMSQDELKQLIEPLIQPT